MLKRIFRILPLVVCFVMLVSGNAIGDSINEEVSEGAIGATEAETNRHIGPSYDGIRAVSDLDTLKEGYIDEEGNVIVPIEHSVAWDFVNGFGILMDEDEEGHETYCAVNTKGEVVIRFDPNLGRIAHFDGEYGIVVKYFDAETPARFALLDKNGNLSTGYEYYTLNTRGESSCYGVIFAEIIDAGNTRRGIINKNGDEVIPFEYSYIENSAKWNQNILSVQKEIDKEQSRYAWGYFYKDGTEMLPCIYESAEVFSEGYGRVMKDGKWAVINAYGQFVTDFEFDGLNVFSEGLAVAVKNDKQGVIDTTGKEILPYIYDYISDFKDGKAVADIEGIDERIILENPLKHTRDVNVYFRDKWIFTDQEPIIESGHTLAPFRSIAETLGYIVDWDEQTKQVILQNEERIIRLTIGSDKAIINQFDDGKPPKEVQLDVTPKIINGRTMVPVRFIAENTGADVEWDAAERNINIR